MYVDRVPYRFILDRLYHGVPVLSPTPVPFSREKPLLCLFGGNRVSGGYKKRRPLAKPPFVCPLLFLEISLNTKRSGMPRVPFFDLSVIVGGKA